MFCKDHMKYMEEACRKLGLSPLMPEDPSITLKFTMALIRGEPNINQNFDAHFMCYNMVAAVIVEYLGFAVIFEEDCAACAFLDLHDANCTHGCTRGDVEERLMGGAAKKVLAYVQETPELVALLKLN